MQPLLPISLFRIHFYCDTTPRLPEYAGSAWRGAFGHALKRTVCVSREPECARCMLYRACAYPYVFETPPPPDATKMRRYTEAPHPFVLNVASTAVDFSEYQLGFTLMGRAQQYFPYCLHALTMAAERGIGKRRQTFRLVAVQQAENDGLSEWREIHKPGDPLLLRPSVVPVPPAVPEWVRVDIETPLRVRRAEQHVTPEGFGFADLFSSLLRRISMLTYFHTDTPLETDFAGLTQRANAVRIAAPALRWYDWTRYSSRQQTTMEMGGLLGHFFLDGCQLDEFWPYLWLGQWTHAGKAATMGLGRYRISAASLPQDTNLV